MLADGKVGALLIEQCHQTLIVVHLCKHLSSLILTSCFVEGTRINVLHHVFIDSLDILAGRLFPKGDVVLVTTHHHVATHVKQSMLGAQSGFRLAEGIDTNSIQKGLLGGDFIFGGVVPLILFALFDTDTIEIFVQVLHVAHHQCIAFLTGGLDGIVSIEPEIFFCRAKVGFPVVVADAFYTIFEVVGRVDAE